MSDFPHVAGIGSDGPGCTCPPIDPTLFDDPAAHRTMCPRGQWLIDTQSVTHLDVSVDQTREELPKRWPGQQELPNDPISVHGFARSTNTPGVSCPCQAILADEAKSFEQEAQGFPAGSPENVALLMHAEFLNQIANRIVVRKKFTAMVQS